MNWFVKLFKELFSSFPPVSAKTVIDQVNADGVLDKIVAAAVPHVRAVTALAEGAPAGAGTSKRNAVVGQLKELFKDELGVVKDEVWHLAVELAVNFVSAAKPAAQS